MVRMLQAVMLLCVALAAGARADEIDNLRQVLTQQMPGMSVGEIRQIPGTTLYEVQINGHELLYVDQEARVGLVGGQMFDLRTRANLTEPRKQALLKADFAALPLDKAIVKVKGKGTRKLAIFTDPDCPFCKRLEGELADIDDTTLYLFLYPLTELHPDAVRKSRLIWCAPDRVKAWDAMMASGVEPEAASSTCEDPTSSIAQVARSLWIRGTPGLVFGSGRLVPGLIPRAQIEQYLSEQPGS